MPNLPPVPIALAAGLAQRRLGTGSRPGLVRKAGAVAAAGASLWLLSGTARAFRRTGTTVNPLDPSRASRLVTDGPNAVSRNPMYVGMAGLLVAHGLLRGGWGTLLPAAAFVAVIDRVQVPAEEAALHDLFGQEYDAYRRRVRRWL